MAVLIKIVKTCFMKRVFIGLFIFFCSTVFSQNNQLTLQQCIETAITNNVQVRQKKLQTEVTAVSKSQSKLNLLPDLNISGNQGKSQGRNIDPFTNSYINQNISYGNYGAGSGVVLFNGLSLRSAVKQSAYAHEAAKLEVQQSKDDVTLDVILAYLQILNNEDLLVLAKQQVEVTSKQVERLEILNNQGAINPALLSDLVGQLKNEELAVANGKNALELSKLNLSQLMNVPYTADIKLERINAADFTQKYPLTSSEVYDKANERLAMVKAAELKTKSAMAAVKVARGLLYPVLSLNGGINTNFSSAATRDVLLNSTYSTSSSYVEVNGSKVPVMVKQNNFASQKLGYADQFKNNIYSSLSLGLNIPIFNSLQSRNRVRLAKIDVRNYELAQENTRLLLRQQVEEAYLRLENAWGRYKIILEQVAAFTASFKAAEIRFQAGVGTSVDYLIAKNSMDRANANLVIVGYDYILRKRVLNYLSGEQIQQ
jgi:outer membrane protein